MLPVCVRVVGDVQQSRLATGVRWGKVTTGGVRAEVLGSEELGLDRAIYAGYPDPMAKVLISLPDDLLERIDREARVRGSTRSAFLQEAAQRELGWPSRESLNAALQRGRDALAGLGPFESADLIRDERLEHDARDRRR
jgi:predicted transcriptional regulator